MCVYILNDAYIYQYLFIVKTKSSTFPCVIWSVTWKMMQDCTWGESGQVSHANCEMAKLLEISSHRFIEQGKSFEAMTSIKQL